MDKETKKLLERANQYNNSISGGVAVQKPKRNFLTSLLPTAGGIIGGIAGSFAAPGVGTAAGGAGGSILGELLAQKLSGEADDGIDKGNLLEEGAWGTLGGLGKAAKSVRGASTVIKAGGGLKDAGNILRFGQFADDAAKGGMSALKNIPLAQLDKMTPAQISKMGNGRPFSAAQGFVENLLAKGDVKGASRLTGMVPDEAVRGTLMSGIPDASSALGGKANILTRGSEQARSSAWGIKPKSKVNGNVIGTEGASELQQYVSKTLKVPRSADANMVARAATSANKQAATQLDGVLKAYGSKAVDPADLNNITKRVVEKSKYSIAGLDPDSSRQVQVLLDQGQSLTSNKDVHRFKQALDDVINYRRGDGSKIPQLEKFGKEYRKDLNKYLSNRMPGYAEANKNFSQSKKVIDLSSAASGGRDIAPLGIPIPGTGGAMQRVQSLVGAGSGGAGSFTGGGLKGSGTIPGILKAQGARGALALMGGQQPQQAEAAPVDPMTGQPLDAVSALGGSPDMLGGGQMGVEAPQQPQSMYSREAAAQDIQRDLQATGGKNMDKYMALWEFLNPQVDEKTAKLSEGQQARSDLITSLGMAGDVMNQGSINYGPIGSRVEGIKSIFNAADPETMTYKNVIGQVRGAITKARAGASLTEGELKLLDTYTPKDTDSEQVVRSKLEQLNNLYGSSAPTGGGLAAEDILSQLQGAY